MKSLKEQIREIVLEAKQDGIVVDVDRAAEALAGSKDHPARVDAIAEAVVEEGVRQARRPGDARPPLASSLNCGARHLALSSARMLVQALTVVSRTIAALLPEHYAPGRGALGQPLLALARPGGQLGFPRENCRQRACLWGDWQSGGEDKIGRWERRRPWLDGRSNCLREALSRGKDGKEGLTLRDCGPRRDGCRGEIRPGNQTRGRIDGGKPARGPRGGHRKECGGGRGRSCYRSRRRTGAPIRRG